MTTHHTMLAAALRSRDVYDALRSSGEAEHLFEDLIPVYEAIHAYYETDSEATSVDVALLRGTLVEGTRDPKRREALGQTVDSLIQATPSVGNARRAARLLGQRRVGERLATGILTGGKAEEVAALISEYQQFDLDVDGDEIPSWTGDVLMPKDDKFQRIPFGPEVLSSRLRGGLYGGHHAILFARPNAGKTALALSIAVRAATKGYRVLYLGNEDPVRDLMMRATMIFAQKGIDEIEADIEGALALARSRGANNLMFKGLSPGSLAEIDRCTRKYKPALLVVDQLRNVNCGRAMKVENMTQRLDVVAQGIRSTAKSNQCAALSLTQAGDSARGKAVLNDGDVDQSNTGISAACDVLAALGVTDDMKAANQRMLTLIKNKVGGREDHFPLHLDPLTLQFQTPR